MNTDGEKQKLRCHALPIPAEIKFFNETFGGHNKEILINDTKIVFQGKIFAHGNKNKLNVASRKYTEN